MLLGYVHEDRGLIPGRGKEEMFPSSPRAQTGSGVHSLSYLMGTGGIAMGRKGTKAWSWSFSSIYCRDECMDNRPPLPNTSSWCGA
jgi:hypothetical protein